MNVFELDRSLVTDYERFARSFTQIRAPDIVQAIRSALRERALLARATYQHQSSFRARGIGRPARGRWVASSDYGEGIQH